MSVQWLNLGAEDTLVASGTAAWIQRAALGIRPFAGEMSDSIPATGESTRHLLDGAIAAAEHATPRVQGAPMSRRRWAWSLVNQWYGSHHTLPLLPEVVERFTAMDRPDLAAFAAEKYDEERGHDEIPLNDLRALGYDAEATVREVTPDPGIVALVEYARRCVRGAEPVEFFGHVYAIERQMLRMGSGFFAALDEALGCDEAPASFLRSHASDLDIPHVEEAIAFFAGLPASDRTAIARGCFRTTKIRHVALAGRYPSEAELESRLARFQTATFAHQPEGESHEAAEGR